MKVKITLTLNIDVNNWVETYGVERKEVRRDVQLYFASLCEQQADALDLLAGYYSVEKRRGPVRIGTGTL